MVTKSEYISLLKKPLVTDANLIAQLEELQEKFPFCGNIQMLLTKGYHDTDSINYEEQLKNTAISIPNRESLYNLIFKTFVTEEISKSVTAEPTKKIEEPIVESEIKTEPVEVSVTIIEETETKEIVEEVKEQIEEEETTSINEIVKNKENTSDKLEELILSHAIGASYVLEDKTEQTNKKEEPTQKVEKEAKTKPVNKKHHSFYTWLTPQEPIIEKTAPKESIDDLVEKFIESKGNEKIQKKDFFSPTNVAKLSIVESDDFVTETLADIYFKQKMYDKALNAYEKLILKNPEKKTYFASQIKKIKGLLE